MKKNRIASLVTAAKITAATLLIGVASASSAAVPVPIDVTWNPSAAGLTTNGPFTFDNVLLNTYANVDITNGGTRFTEQGYLSMFSFINNPGNIITQTPSNGFGSPPPVLGTPYSLYVSFTGSGTQSPGIPSNGAFTSLNYTLLGATGVTRFVDTDSDGVFEVQGNAPVTLGSGSLISGTTHISASLSPSANVNVTFAANPAFATFFVNPSAFTALNIAAAFTNTPSVVTLFALGGNGDYRMSLDGGGGNATFSVANTTPIPEPETYTMLLAGIGLMGYVVRRRRAERNKV